MTSQLIRRGGEAARVGPWRGAASTALVAPAPGRHSISPEFLEWCCARLSQEGYDRVVSSALLPSDTDAYMAAGFRSLEQLHLLSRSLDDIPPPPRVPARLRRGGKRHLPAVAAVDQAAFPPFWTFDEAGLEDARTITARSRFRVAYYERKVVGYAITGLGEEQGYLQRLAVEPRMQHRSIGSALVIDGLHWLARAQALRVMVNTQVGNEAALRLYLALGFHLEPARLEVLSRTLT